MRAPHFRALAALAGLLACVIGVWKLEAERAGLIIAPVMVGTTPATIYHKTNAPPAPAVVIAHGFAGSRQFMEAYALALAQAGYVAVSFDFEGHGRNPTPMRGDVTHVDGTTQYLMRETGRVSGLNRPVATRSTAATMNAPTASAIENPVDAAMSAAPGVDHALITGIFVFQDR